jgi:hypothetical protein
VPLGCSLGGELQRILYGGRWWLPPSPGRGWVLCVKVPEACPNTQGCSRMLTNPLVIDFGCRFKLDNLVPLPSLILGLLARPSTPFKCWKSGAPLKSQLSVTLHSWTLKWVQQGTWECVTYLQSTLQGTTHVRHCLQLQEQKLTYNKFAKDLMQMFTQHSRGSTHV